MNAILIDAGLPPLVISYGDKQRYFDCLGSANKGDLSPTVELLLEAMEISLQAIVPIETPVAPIPIAEKPTLSATPSAPLSKGRRISDRLAALMRQKIATVAVEREERYKAWLSAFVSFRQEFELACTAFNDQFGSSPFRVLCKPYDELLFEKYDGLLKGERTPRTWFIGSEISGPKRSERFVFFFQQMTDKTKLALRNHRPKPTFFETDVTLGVSRFAEGRYFRLFNEPIRLREVVYFSGELWFALETKPNSIEMAKMSAGAAVDSFLEDAADAYF